MDHIEQLAYSDTDMRTITKQQNTLSDWKFEDYKYISNKLFSNC